MGRQWNTIIESLGPLTGGTMSINANLTEIEALLTTLQADVADGLVVTGGSTVVTGGTLGQLTGGTVNVTNTTRAISSGTVNASVTGGTITTGSVSLTSGTLTTGTVTAAQATAASLNATVVGSGSFTAAQSTAANLNATVVQGTATNLKTQAENYQGGSAVGSGNPLQVTLANTGANSSALLVTNRGAVGEATVSSFTSTTSATLKSSNSNRKVLTIYNEGAGNLHVLYGSGTASTTNYSVKLFSGDYLEVDKYTGQVNAIFASAGTARVTEIT
jgi:hypothetical protein